MSCSTTVAEARHTRLIGAHAALWRCGVLLLVAAWLAMAAPARAATSGSGSAYGLYTSLSAVPLLGLPTTLTLGPSPTGVSGTAPADFNQSGSLLSISGSLLGASISAQTLAASTQSALASNAANSAASVQNLNLGLTLLGLQAQVVSSTASGTCKNGSVSLSGSSSLAGVSLSGLLQGLTVNASPAANTTLLNVAGIKIPLHGQHV